MTLTHVLNIWTSVCEKMPKPFSRQTKEMVLKLYDYFERESRNEGPLLPLTQVRARVAEALNISKGKVSAILKERHGPSGMETNTIKSPNKRRRKQKPVTGIDSFDADAIRNHVYGYFADNKHPTLKALITSLKAADLFNGSAFALKTILKNIGFQYVKRNQRKVIMERSDIALKRIAFLRRMSKVTNWDNVVFLDETWLNANHTVSKSWTDGTKASTSKVPMGKGGRLIICHAGSAGGGFVEDSLLAFTSKTTGDYHEEMNGETFKTWFEKMLTQLPEPSTIVMDNDAYHSIQINKAPTKHKNKSEMVAWLQSNGVAADMTLTKLELFDLVEQTRSRRPEYVIDNMALEHGHEVVRLPPYHCHYNAIELIWAQVKGYAARHNTTPPFSTNKMMSLLQEACQKVTQEDWAKVVEKTKNIIMSEFARDIHIDNLVENEFIINVGDTSSSSASVSEDSDVRSGSE